MTFIFCNQFLTSVSACFALLSLITKYTLSLSTPPLIEMPSNTKEKIFDVNKSLSEITYELGFKYPQHFTRLFKQKVGHTPNEYRMLN